LYVNVSFLPHPLAGDKMWKQVDINNVTGLHLGDMPDGGLITGVKFMCKNETTPLEVAMETQFGTGFNWNLTLDDFRISTLLNNTKVIDNKVMYERFPFKPERSSDEALTELWTAIANDIDGTYADGIDLKSHPIVGFVAGLLRHTLMTPFMQDNYYYGGFSWITDGV